MSGHRPGALVRGLVQFRALLSAFLSGLCASQQLAKLELLPFGLEVQEGACIQGPVLCRDWPVVGAALDQPRSLHPNAHGPADIPHVLPLWCRGPGLRVSRSVLVLDVD